MGKDHVEPRFTGLYWPNGEEIWEVEEEDEAPAVTVPMGFHPPGALVLPPVKKKVDRPT